MTNEERDNLIDPIVSNLNHNESQYLSLILDVGKKVLGFGEFLHVCKVLDEVLPIIKKYRDEKEPERSSESSLAA